MFFLFILGVTWCPLVIFIHEYFDHKKHGYAPGEDAMSFGIFFILFLWVVSIIGNLIWSYS